MKMHALHLETWSRKIKICSILGNEESPEKKKVQASAEKLQSHILVWTN